MSKLLDRITLEPSKMNGKPCVRGLRIRVIDILEMLSAGMSADESLSEYPYLEADDRLAAQAYGGDGD